MKRLLACVCLVMLGLPPLAAQEKPAEKKTSYKVPYRLTAPKHILVRARINGKGPYNFILDTGAPILIVAEDVAGKAGLKGDANGWGKIGRFEIEGGVVIPDARVLVHTPFQLEGMNGMGLAGATIHGLIGYDILARYQMEIDFTRGKMVWTPLSWEPKAPFQVGKRPGGAGGGLEIVGTIMKALGGLMGRQNASGPVARGFLGVELADAALEDIRVRTLLEGGPAARAGLAVGDRVTRFQGRTVLNVEDVERFARKVRAGDEVELTVTRDRETRTITIQAAEGL